MSWAARDWAVEVWSGTRTWSRDERNKLVGEATDLKLSPGAKLVLFALADRADKNLHVCWPAKERLAADAGLGVHAVQAALKQLVAAELIDRTPRFKDGRRTSDLYALRIPSAWLGQWEAERGVQIQPRTETESEPEPTQEPSVSLRDDLSPTSQQGSGRDSAPLSPSCARCGCRLAADHAFALHCSPCESALAAARDPLAVAV